MLSRHHNSRSTLPPRTRAASRARDGVRGWVLGALFLAAPLLRAPVPVAAAPASASHVAAVGAAGDALLPASLALPALERAVRHAPRGVAPRGDTPLPAAPRGHRDARAARSGAPVADLGVVPVVVDGRGYDATAPPRLER